MAFLRIIFNCASFFFFMWILYMWRMPTECGTSDCETVPSAAVLYAFICMMTSVVLDYYLFVKPGQKGK